jgi:hypothetical protein
MYCWADCAPIYGPKKSFSTPTPVRPPPPPVSAPAEIARSIDGLRTSITPPNRGLLNSTHDEHEINTLGAILLEGQIQLTVNECLYVKIII